MYHSVAAKRNISKSIVNGTGITVLVNESFLEYDSVIRNKIDRCPNDKFGAMCIKNHLNAIRAFIKFLPEHNLLLKIELLKQAVLYAKALPIYFDGEMPSFLFCTEY